MTTRSRAPQMLPVPVFRTGMPREPSPRGRASTAEEAIANTIGLLRKTQHEDGYWWGELESNPTMEAEYIFLTHILGAVDQERWDKTARHIERQQGEDGGWRLYYGAASDLSTTVECYAALKMAGETRNPRRCAGPGN